MSDTGRKLHNMRATALAGARHEAMRLRLVLLRAEEELARGETPTAEISAGRLNFWITQFHTLQEIEGTLAADEPAATGMRNIKVRFTGLGRAKTLTYQTAQDVALDQEVQVPRWPDMPPGPPLRGTVVALSSDYQGQAVTIIGG